MIVDAEGRPVGGVLVRVVYPVMIAATKALKVIELQSATTADSGRFEINASNTGPLVKFGRLNDGWVNLDLVAVGSSLALYRGVSRRNEQGRWVGPPDDKGSVDLGVLRLALGEPGVGKARRNAAAARVRTPGSSARATCTRAGSKVLAIHKLATVVGSIHTASSSTARFTYGPTANSLVGIAVRWGSGPWSVSGVATVANPRYALTASVGPAAHRLVKSTFIYIESRAVDTCAGIYYTIKAATWVGGASVSTATTDLSAACANSPYTGHKILRAAGATFTRSANLAFTYPEAVNLSSFGTPPVPVRPSARSGYLAGHVSARWLFSVQGSLCGDTASPLASKRIFAGN
jgi:hypothetical protein